MKIRTLSFAVLLILAFTCNSTFAKTDWSAKILNYGTYEFNKGNAIEIKAPKKGEFRIEIPAGSKKKVVMSCGKYRLLKQTTEVEGRLGVKFGFEYSLEGPEEEELPTTIKVIHPKLTDPSGKVFATTERSKTSSPGDPDLQVIWTFEYPWEIVEGTWTLELWAENRKLLSKDFFVKVP